MQAKNSLATFHLVIGYNFAFLRACFSVKRISRSEKS